MTKAESWIKELEDGVVLFLHVQTGAKVTEAIGIHNNRLKIKIKAVPVEGAANAALIKWIAKIVGIPKTDVLLSGGVRSKVKSVKLRGVKSEEVSDCLLRIL